MNLDYPTNQLLQARGYLKERGFSAATLTAVRSRQDVPDWDSRVDVIGFEQHTGRWAAYTTPITSSARTWEMADQFDDPIGAYLCAELENWGRP